MFALGDAARDLSLNVGGRACSNRTASPERFRCAPSVSRRVHRRRSGGSAPISVASSAEERLAATSSASDSEELRTCRRSGWLGHWSAACTRYPNALSGVSLYPAWMALTVASELGPSYWVEPSIHTRFVGELDQRHARGNLAPPAWTGDEEVASSGAGGALSGCREDVRPSRQDRHLVVDAVRVGHREDERFLGQVEPGVREQHVHRWRRNSRERRCERRGRRVELIDRRREWFRRGHIRQLSLRAVHDDERKAEDIGGFRDLLCLVRRRRSLRGRQRQPADRLGGPFPSAEEPWATPSTRTSWASWWCRPQAPKRSPVGPGRTCPGARPSSQPCPASNGLAGARRSPGGS